MMHVRIQRTDGKTGNYTQDDRRRSEVLVTRLDPQKLFRSGPIVIGMLNPFSVLNPDEVCWVEVRTELALKSALPPNLEYLHKLADRHEYELLLAHQWPKWLKHSEENPGKLLEALVELSFRGGESIYLRALGREADVPINEAIFGPPAITATFDPNGVIYINPKCVVRARIYSSRQSVRYPEGLWFAQADEI
jgi:hypothetical protein